MTARLADGGQMLSWVKLPVGWIRSHGLNEFRWGKGGGGKADGEQAGGEEMFHRRGPSLAEDVSLLAGLDDSTATAR